MDPDKRLKEAEAKAQIAERAKKLYATISTPGWTEIKGYIEKLISDSQYLGTVLKDVKDLNNDSEIAMRVKMAQSRRDSYKNIFTWIDQQLYKGGITNGRS